MENTKDRHKVEIHGLKSHYGTLRAKLCMRYLRKYMRHLYEKPFVRVYYDSDWIDYVNKIKSELGDKYRRLYYLKNPVIIFLDGKYIGDHRALIQHLAYEHGIIPDLPYPDLFPDFTSFLPKHKNKQYVYLDIRVGDLSDYIIGKLVFELHQDVAPETCKFFSYLCEPFGPLQFSERDKVAKETYLGSSIRRICGKAFIQGGVVPEAKLLRVNDENFSVKHDRRGVLSLANHGRNQSTTEFVISLQPNPWMDGNNVAFGRLIFGESLLEAIEEVPTYYQSPLRDILIVGCGVIPSEDLRDNIEHQTKVLKMKTKNINEVIQTKKWKLGEIRSFEKKISELIKRNYEERKCELIYREMSSISSLDDVYRIGEEWQREENETEESYKYSESINIREEDERIEELEMEGEITREFLTDEHFENEVFEENKLNEDINFNELTLAEILWRSKKKFDKQKTNMIVEFIYSILDKVFLSIKSEDDSIQLDEIYVPEIEDVIDVRDVPSGQLLETSYYEGLYSLPNSLRENLIDAYNNLSPSKLKLLGMEARSLLEKGGIPEETLQIYSSEDFISGLVMAVINIGLIKNAKILQNSLESPQTSTLSIEEVGELVDEIWEDTIELIQIKGPDFIRSSLAEKASISMHQLHYVEEFVYEEDFNFEYDKSREELNVESPLEEHEEERTIEELDEKGIEYLQ